MIRIAVLLAVLLAAWPASAQGVEKRLALVLSNQDYPASIGRLSQTHTDGDVVGAALSDVGFKVTRGRDLDSDHMDQILAGFEKDINQAATGDTRVVVFLYASMHGAAIEVDGRPRNFLLPAKEDLSTAGQVIRKAFRLDQIVSGLTATKARSIIVVSDACRNNLATSYSKGSGEKGFVEVRGGPGVLIAYATEQGATAPDDGVFAKALSGELRVAGREASVTMLKALEKVARLRSRDGQPYMTSGGLPEDLCFNGCPAAPEKFVSTVPLLMPSAVVLKADAKRPTLSATTGGYIATYDLPKFVVVVKALSKVHATGAVRGPSGELVAAPRDDRLPDRSSYKYSAGEASAQVSFVRFAADYLIMFNCREIRENDVCVGKEDAVEFVESMFVVNQSQQ